MGHRRNISVMLGIGVVFMPTWFGITTIESGLQAGIHAGAGAALGLIVYEVVTRMGSTGEDDSRK
jgi:hypothetical protein